MLINFSHLKTYHNALKQKFKSLRGNWNQNDPQADDYIKNRPFYSEEGKVVVLPTTTLNSGFFMINTPFVVNQEYTIIFNGIQYQCIAREYDGYIMLGNNAIYEYDYYDETDTGEPFAIEAPDGELEAYIYTEVESPTVSITVKTEIVHQIDKKYVPIPDGLATMDEVQSELDSVYYDLSTRITNDSNDIHTRITSVIDNSNIKFNAITSTLDTKADANHNHDDKYDAKGSADTALNSAKEYADSEIANHNHDDKYDAKGSADSALNSARKHSDNDFDIITSDTLTWDGDTTDKVVCMDSLGFSWVKVSNVIPNFPDNTTFQCTQTATSGQTVTNTFRVKVYDTGVIKGSGICIIPVDGMEYEGTIYPEAGTYVSWHSSVYYSSFTFPGYNVFIDEKSLKQSFLPVVPISKGGTGATNASDALTNLGFILHNSTTDLPAVVNGAILIAYDE